MQKSWIQAGLRVAFAILLSATLLSCASSSRPLQLLSGAGPIYPPAARAAGVEGRVVVAYDVTPSGEVVNARVVDANPSGIFDEAALVAVRSWRFNAPREEGRAVAANNRRSEVRFSLEGTSKYDRYDPPQ